MRIRLGIAPRCRCFAGVSRSGAVCMGINDPEVGHFDPPSLARACNRESSLLRLTVSRW